MHSNSIIYIVVQALYFTLSLAGISAGESLVLDRFVAGVNDELITFSEYHQALDRYRLVGKAEGAIPPEAGRQVLQTLIDQRLLLQEARRFQVDPVSDEEIKRAVPHFEQQIEALDRASRAEFLEQMRRQLLIKRFIQRRIFVRVGFEEVKDYYRRHAQEFADKDLLDVREAIEELLREEQRNLKLRDLLKEIRKRARLVIYFPE
ncbi:MAG: SurA N-terminal domain-containing protein [Nitrospirae bacterium]|nr:SurA N-terminal domain-containing protein [Nitrospirota bacterium]